MNQPMPAGSCYSRREIAREIRFTLLRTSIHLEPITDPQFSCEIPRARGVRLEFMAELRHVDAQILALFGVGGTPYFLKQLTMRDDFARVPDESGQQFVFNRGEMNLPVGNTDLPLGQVHS